MGVSCRGDRVGVEGVATQGIPQLLLPITVEGADGIDQQGTITNAVQPLFRFVLCPKADEQKVYKRELT